MDTIRPRYSLTPAPYPPPYRAGDYAEYLRMYGSVYGDMSDPVKRAETIAALRHRDAKSLASAHREHWRIMRGMTTEDLRHELTVKRYQIEHCAEVRPWNIHNNDIRTFRMIWNELARRAKGN